MKQLFYQIQVILTSFILFLFASCSENVPKYQLPVEGKEIGVRSPCDYVEFTNRSKVPHKIMEEARKAFKEFLTPNEIDEQLEFSKFRIYEKCDKLVSSNQLYIKYMMYYKRNFNNEILSSISFKMNFNEDQTYKGQWGLGESSYKPIKDYLISKLVLDSILESNNFAIYKNVFLEFDGREYELRFSKPKNSEKFWNSDSYATVNIHTGEFNSREEWEKATATNISLLPKYGGINRSSKKLEKDVEFINSLIGNGRTNSEASEYLISQASDQLNSNPKKAMHLFNQAYLLDSTNANVYWGFGILAIKGNDYRSDFWYDKGIQLDSNNINILRGYGHNAWYQFRSFKNRYSGKEMTDKEKSREEEFQTQRFERAENYFLKVLSISPGHVKTMINLADLYLDRIDCENAKEFYMKSKSLRNNCSAQCFESQLEKKCGVLK